MRNKIKVFAPFNLNMSSILENNNCRENSVTREGAVKCHKWCTERHKAIQGGKEDVEREEEDKEKEAETKERGRRMRDIIN